jgi:plasmid stabilization system protein ParE
MTLPVYFSRNAMLQLEEFGERYFVFGGEGLVNRLDEEIAAIVRRVGQFPASSPLVRAGIRRTLTDQLTLSVFYRVHREYVEIIQIADQRQDPRRLRFK